MRGCLSQVKKFVSVFAAVIPVACAGTVFAWNNFALPDVDRRIKNATDPIIEAIEFQNYLLMATMSDSSIERATKRFTASRKGVVR